MKKIGVLLILAAAFSVAAQTRQLNYLASDAVNPTQALVVLHGHPRDANRTYDAAIAALDNAGVAKGTVVIAPIYQVPDSVSAKCRTSGVPPPSVNDLLWTCESWMEGGLSEDKTTDSFKAFDDLLQRVAARYPTISTLTVAGFSAGAQMVQHYIGFANASLPASIKLRYVVSDPGTWLYFDPITAPEAASCPRANQWKYGTDALPAYFTRTAAQARAVYAAADISYMEAENDNANVRGAFYGILDKSCAANLQGPFRLQRGMAYADYDRTFIAPGKQRRLTVVPSCGHSVSCVFPSVAARAVLLGSH